MTSHARIGISIPTDMLETIENLRTISNRSKFIVGLIREPLELLKGGQTP